MKVTPASFVVLALFSAVQAFLSEGEFQHQCAPPGEIKVSESLPAGTTAPPIPQLGRKFQTMVEAAFPKTDSISTAKEYFDAGRGLAAVIEYAEGLQLTSILDYNHNQVIQINAAKGIPTTCTTSDLRTNQVRTFFESNSSPSHPPAISSTINALFMDTANGLTYMGKSTIRGIKVDHWQTCLFHVNDGTYNFTADVYFSDESWFSTYFQQQIPVQWSFTANNTQVYVYTVVNFKSLVEDEEFDQPHPFQIPDDVLCEGNETFPAKVIPTFPDNYTYTYEQEIITNATGKQTVTTQKIFLDTKHKLLSVDHMHGNMESSPCPQGTDREVYDFSSGLGYCLDDDLDQCTVLPHSGHVKVTSLSDMLFLNSTAQYRGQRTARSINSDVFVSNYTTRLEEAIVTSFFSLDGPSAVPLRVDVRSKTGGPTRQYNVYNFKSTKPQYKDLSISSCFNGKMIALQIEFKGATKRPSLSQPTRRAAVATLVEGVATAGGLSYTQIQRPDVTLTADRANFTCLVLPDATTPCHAHVCPTLFNLQNQLRSGQLSIHVPQLNETLEGVNFTFDPPTSPN